MTNQWSGREPGTWEVWKIDGPHGYNTLRYVYARWNWPHGLAYFLMFCCYYCLLSAFSWVRFGAILALNSAYCWIYVCVSGICVRCLYSLPYSDKFGVEACDWRKIPLVDCSIVITNVYYDMYLCFLESLEDSFLML